MNRQRLWIVLGVLALGAGVGAYFWWRGDPFDDPALLERLRQADLGTRDADADATTDWSGFRGPLRDGVVRDAAPLADWEGSPPEELWRGPCGGGYSSVAVADGRAYTHDRQGNEEGVLCFDAESGELLWRYAYPADYSPLQGYSEGPRATPAVHEGRVYAVGSLGRFLCLEAADEPKLLWEHDLIAEFDAKLPSWGLACSPLVEGDLVIVQPGGDRGSVAAFDRESGRLRWAALDDPNGYSSPLAADLAGLRQIVAFTGERVVGLKPADGGLLWTFDWPTSYKVNAAMPVIVGGHVFISSDYGSGCALLAIEGGDSGWTARPVFTRPRKMLSAHFSTPVLKDGLLFGFDGSVTRADLTCIDVRGPTRKWDTGDLTGGSLIRAGDRLIVQAQNGTVALVDATGDDFRPLGEVRGLLKGGQAWATPALVGDRLYVRDSEKVVCLRLPTRPE